MPRQPLGDRPMTDAERQARYRAARTAGAPVVRMRRPADHRSRARRWKDAVAGHPNPAFQFHHQPFNYFAPYAEGTAARAEHLNDIEDFDAALSAGALPAVSFAKSIGSKNEHLDTRTCWKGKSMSQA